MGSPPPVKRMRDGLYPVHRWAVGTSGVGSRRGGVQGVPLHPPSFPPAKMVTQHKVAGRDLPHVPPHSPGLNLAGSPDVGVPLGGPEPPQGISQWVDLRTVPVPTAIDPQPPQTTGDPMDMLNQLCTGPPSPNVPGGAHVAAGGGTDRPPSSQESMSGNTLSEYVEEASAVASIFLGGIRLPALMWLGECLRGNLLGLVREWGCGRR